MEKAILIKATGESIEVMPGNGKDFTLEEMYKHCNCDCVQFLQLADGRMMICDDEGKLKDDWHVNERASELYMEGRMNPKDYEKMMEARAKRMGFSFHTLGDPEHAHEIAGDALVCPASMIR
jgi:hypothetical protein